MMVVELEMMVEPEMMMNDDGAVQDDDGGAGDNNDVELSQWACDFPSFGKKRCFEANTL